MEFRGLSLTHQSTFLGSPIKQPKMSDTKFLRCPLTRHLEKTIETKPWGFAGMPVTLPIVSDRLLTIGRITSVVGGFVGSKSQRNREKDAKFPLNTLIQEILYRQEIQEVLNQRIKRFISSQAPEEKSPMAENCSVVEEIVTNVCRSPPRLSECSLDSNDSDFIVFENDDCSQDDELEETEDDVTDDDEEETVIFEQCNDQKKVRFNPDVKVHVMRVWDFASRKARISPWLQIGRDRDRFAKRIASCEAILTPVLSAAHREKVRARFDR